MGATSDEEEASSHNSNSDERPLKKARYIWQIKGKYHLKSPGEADEKEKMKLDSVESTDDQDKSDCVEVCNPSDHKETISSPTAHINTVDLPESVANDAVSESLYPSYEMYRLSNTISNLELTKWQDRQVVRSCVDNTINGVLEVMGFAPLPFEAEDVSDDDIIPNDFEIEDEAVLMAIHNHGLQRTEESEQSSKRKLDSETFLPQCSCRQSTSACSNEIDLPLPDPFHRRAVNLSRSEVEVLLVPSTDNYSCNVPAEISKTPCSTLSAGLVPVPCGNVDSSSACFHPSETINQNIVAADPSIEIPCDESLDTGQQNSPPMDQNDFINQAVAIAILKKGLSTINGSEIR